MSPHRRLQFTGFLTGILIMGFLVFLCGALGISPVASENEKSLVGGIAIMLVTSGIGIWATNVKE